MIKNLVKLSIDYSFKAFKLHIKKNLSVWSPSCVTHCFWQDAYSSPNWEVPQKSGNNIDLIVKDFLKNEGKKQYELLDKINWPENAGCARDDKLEFNSESDL